MSGSENNMDARRARRTLFEASGNTVNAPADGARQPNTGRGGTSVRRGRGRPARPVDDRRGTDRAGVHGGSDNHAARKADDKPQHGASPVVSPNALTRIATPEPAEASAYDRLAAMASSAPTASDKLPQLAPPPERSAYEKLGAVQSRRTKRPVNVAPAPIRAELHSHYNGVLPSEVFVTEIFGRHDIAQNLVSAHGVLLESGALLPWQRQLFSSARTNREKADLAAWFLAARQRIGPRRPAVSFPAAYAMRRCLKAAFRPLEESDPWYEGGGALLSPAEARELWQMVLQDFEALDARRVPTHYTLLTQLGEKRRNDHGIFAAEVIREAYGAFCRQNPDTQVVLEMDSTSKRLMLARAVVHSRVDDGLTHCQLEGHLDIPGWAFQILCEPRRGRNGIDIRFLRGLTSQSLQDDDPSALANELRGLKHEIRKGMVIGVDFRGSEASFTPAALGSAITEVYDLLRSTAEELNLGPLVLRIHVGEGHMPGGRYNLAGAKQARKNIETLLSQLESMPIDRKRVEIRLGHAANLNLAQAQRIIALGLPVEVNVGSNLRTGALRKSDQSPVLKLLFAEAMRRKTDGPGKLAIHLSTDGGGVMEVSLADELKNFKSLVNSFFNGKRGASPPVHLSANNKMQMATAASMVTHAGLEKIKHSRRSPKPPEIAPHLSYRRHFHCTTRTCKTRRPSRCSCLLSASPAGTSQKACSFPSPAISHLNLRGERTTVRDGDTGSKSTPSA